MTGIQAFTQAILPRTGFYKDLVLCEFMSTGLKRVATVFVLKSGKF